jgi:hypothetical protein
MAETNEIGNAEPCNRIPRHIAERRHWRSPKMREKRPFQPDRLRLLPISPPFAPGNGYLALPFLRRLPCPVPPMPEWPGWSVREPMTHLERDLRHPGRQLQIQQRPLYPPHGSSPRACFSGSCSMKTARQIVLTGHIQILEPNSVNNGAAKDQRGARTITTWRPSKRASCSTLANSATSALTLSSSLVPISWWAISRPR